MNGRESVLDIIGSIAKYVVIIIVVLFFISLARRGYETGYSIFNQSAVDEAGQGHEVTVEIAQGMSVKEIGKLLKKNGLIKDDTIFAAQEYFSSYHGELMPGTYTLSTEMTPDEIMAILAENYTEDASGDTSESDSTGSAESTSESASDDTSGSTTESVSESAGETDSDTAAGDTAGDSAEDAE